jgi:SAM-dependent methyltransferase
LFGLEFASARAVTAQISLSSIGGAVARGDAEAGLPFRDCSVDAVVCADVIEHLIDPGAALCEMNRVLRPGGRVLLTTPNVASLKRRFQLLRGESPRTSGLPDTYTEGSLLDGGHLHYFTFSRLERLVRAAGFVVLEERGFGRLGKVHDWLPTLLSSSCVIVAGKSLDRL